MRKLYESSAGDIFSVFGKDYVQIISFTSTSPKGVTCYKCFPYFLKEVVCCGVPSPTGATYYE